jgi:hypothetical protein
MWEQQRGSVGISNRYNCRQGYTPPCLLLTARPCLPAVQGMGAGSMGAATSSKGDISLVTGNMQVQSRTCLLLTAHLHL